MVSKILKVAKKIRTKFAEYNQPLLKAGFIGQGSHAITNLYPSLPYANIDVIATCARHNADYGDFRKMLDEVKVDGIIACVNAQMHYEIAKECALRDIPVFVEKPPCANSTQAKELCDMDAKIMVGFNKRFAKTYKLAKASAGNDVERITINVSVGNAGSDRNLMMEVGIHYIDLMNFFGGKGTLNISGGLSWAQPSEYVEIISKNKRIVIENIHKITCYEGNNCPIVWQPNYTVPDIENHLISLNGYIGELTEFAKGNYSPNIQDGYIALKRIEDGY